MKHETFKKLKDSTAVYKLEENQMVHILVNANGAHQPKLYTFLFNSKTAKSQVLEVVDENLLLQIAGE